MDFFYYLSCLFLRSLTHRGFFEFGEMAEWSKAHAWRACMRQKRIKGSNPFLSARM